MSSLAATWNPSPALDRIGASQTQAPAADERAGFETWDDPEALAQAIRAAQAGEEWAFAHLVNHYRSLAERVAYPILRTEEAVADAVQEALIKVYHALPRFTEGNFPAWLARIVTNTCYDHLRRRKRRPALSLDRLQEDGMPDIPSPRPDADPEQAALAAERRAQLIQAIRALSPAHQAVVILVDVHGYDYTEAADHLGIPVGTVKSRLSRARAALRERLLAQGLVARP